ncbi:monocarboxylate transporter 12-B [Procambarus clarkii]|uniref:monocarboxylate transporter 12-B n=1 Tax=Procambarus clarkii TaxID=6728 RepID=UPI001E672645|nr:monocarboxylate transporter 9-like [Procambarus clarkii]
MSVDDTSRQKTRAPDGGWGWMVAFGSFLMLALVPMISLSFSILFSGFLREQKASSTTIAWIFNLHIFNWNLVGLLTGPLASEFGFRKVSLMGTAAASVFLILTSFTDSIGGLMVNFSLCGIFGGLGCKPCFILIPMYFDKKRGQAVAILMAGIALGQFMGPPIVRLLLEHYALRGAGLIIGAVLLNSCVGAAFFQPVEWHLKPYDEETPEILPVADKSIEGSYMNSDETANDDGDDVLGRKGHRVISGEVGRRAMQRSCSLHSDECSSVSMAVSLIDLTSISLIVQNEIDTLSTDKEDEEEEEASGTNRALLTASRVIRSLISDLKIFKSPRALIIAIAGLCVANSYLNFHMILPFAIQNAGYSLEDAAWCMSIAAVANLVARLSTSSLSDCAWFNMRFVYMLGAGVVAASTLVFSFLKDLTWMKVTMGVWGYGVGTNISLYTLIMAKYMGVQNMAAIFGCQSLIMAFGHITLGPLLGLIRDLSGSYAVAMWAMSAEVSICVVLWLFMPAAIAYDKRIEARASSRHVDKLAE